MHSGVVDGLTWHAADGPHRLRDTVSAGSLLVEPGTLVCGGPGAALAVSELVAEGAADETIVFTAEDPAEPWGGISASRMTISHALLEHALVAAQGRHISIRNTTIRRIQGQAAIFGGTGTGLMIEAVIDSACLSLCPDSGSFGASVVVFYATEFHFEDSQILNSGAGGLRVEWRSRIALLGGRIEGSSGIGLNLNEDPGGGRRVTLTDVRPIVITGGSSYPARIALEVAATLLETREAQEGWMGNAADTVLVTSATSRAENVTIHPGLAWAVYGGGPTSSPAQIASLELEPGASLQIRGPSGLTVGQLLSRGTSDAPVMIGSDTGTAARPTKLWLDGSEAPDTSRIEHTRFLGVRVEARFPVVFEDVTVNEGDIVVSAEGSRLTSFRLIGSHEHADAALTIAASNVQVDLCEITGSARDGVRVDVAAGVRISECNIEGNAGVGVRNLAAEVVDAGSVWWGDPQGPHAPEGDGVAGSVDFLPFLLQPVNVGFAF